MNHSDQSAAAMARMKSVHEAGFAAFMSRAEVKLLVSLIPPANPPEALTSLLRAAYDAGAGVGAGALAGEFVDTLVKGLSKPDED